MKALKALFGRSFQLFLILGAVLVVWINVWAGPLHQPIPDWWDGSWIKLWFWCLVGYGIYRLVKWRRRRTAARVKS